MTTDYPSQQNRSRVWIDTTLHNRFSQWCQSNNLIMKHVIEALIQMVLQGELDISQPPVQVRQEGEK